MSGDENKGVRIGIIGTGKKAMELVAILSGGAPLPQHQLDAIGKAADVEGPHGRAWMCDLDAVRAKYPDREDATLVSWLVEAPWAHPAWHSYAITLVHLRATADARPTRFYLPGATHELWVYAVTPDTSRGAYIAGAMSAAMWLQPSNFGAQIIADDDAAAVQRVEAAVREIVAGFLSPDTDYLRAWVERFGDNMIKGR